MPKVAPKYIGVLQPSAGLSRRREWFEVFGSYQAPVTDCRPHLAQEPTGAILPFFAADVSRLSQEQIERAARRMARQFEVPYGQVLAGIARGEPGLPLLAYDVVIIEEIEEDQAQARKEAIAASCA